MKITQQMFCFKMIRLSWVPIYSMDYIYVVFYFAIYPSLRFLFQSLPYMDLKKGTVFHVITYENHIFHDTWGSRNQV